MRSSTRIAFAIVALAAVSCNRTAPTPTGQAAGLRTADRTSPSTALRDANDPCGLLERREVEAVVGPLAGAPFRTREGAETIEPLAGGDTCAYQTPDFRAVLVTIVWHDGPLAMRALTLPSQLLAGAAPTAPDHTAKAAKTLLPGGLDVDGEWDEARGLGCCEIFALRGGQLVTLDYRAWRPDTKSAVRILNAALLRLERPLAVDGNAGIEAATARAALRPTPRPACDLVPRAEVESVLGPLEADPKPDASDATRGCVYRFTQPEPKSSPLADAPKEFKAFLGAVTGGRTGLVAGVVDTGLQVRWRGGFRAASDSLLVAGAVAENDAGDPAIPKRPLGRIEGGPWDDAVQTSLTFTAVKKDVGITIDTPPMLTPEQIELRRRLVAKAIDAIGDRK